MRRAFGLGQLLFIFLLFLSPRQSVASEPPKLSAARKENERFEDALKRVLPRSMSASSFLKESSYIGTIDFSQVPNWSQRQLQFAFSLIRDDRFLTRSSALEFNRRIPWLYTSDGCWVRAELARKRLEANRFPELRKLFIYGSLHAHSPYGWGSVSWAYHVAPIVRVDQQIYVLDPALEPRFPLSLNEWVVRSGSSPEDVGHTRSSLCSAKAYGPEGGDWCERQTEHPDLPADTEWFLNSEWTSLTWLELSPEKLLGHFPPWNSLPSSDVFKVK